MKHLLLSSLLVSAFVPDLFAAAKLEETKTPYEVAERGAHHRVWQSVTKVVDGDGRELVRTNSYTELATGLHYQEGGQWKETQELIELHPKGAIANKGPHKVVFQSNINTEGAVDLRTPDGKRFRSWIGGLSYYDTATGQNVLIADLKDSIGQIVSSNEVIYPDAFTDFKADVRYIYTKAGLEQDIILRERPPGPAEYGLDPATTRLQVLTEFFNPPIPAGKATMRKNGLNVDDVIDFGAMRIGRGKAFHTDDREKNMDVDKVWLKMQGRDFLIEEVPVPRMEELFEFLPAAPTASVRKKQGVRHVVSSDRLLPTRKVAKAKESRTIRVAKLEAQTLPGFVIDYPITLVTATNFTFQGDKTYYVSSSVTLSGTTTIEGGTVVKGADSVVQLMIAGTVNCKTDAYRPAIFTGKDDDSVGESISGSTGVPSGLYWGTAIRLSSGNQNLRYLRVGHALLGIFADFTYTNGIAVSHSQFANCVYPITAVDSTLHLKNVLISESSFGFYGEGTASFTAEHITARNLEYLTEDFGASSLGITNSLLVSVTNIGSMTSITSNHVESTTSSAVFQTVGGGKHYLASGSPYRNAGTTNLSVGLLEELAKKTTYPPIVYSNVTITATTTFYPQAQRDYDVPDLGYHYDPLDYVFGGVQASNDITFAAGTAAGWFRTTSGWQYAGQGINLADTKVARFDGRVDAPTYWVRCNTVQESNTGIWQGGYGPGGITSRADQYSYNPALASEVRGQFLLSSMMAGEQGCHFRDDYGYLNVHLQNSEIHSGLFGGYVISFYLTNCLLNRVALTQIEGWSGTGVALRNCTSYGGEFTLSPYRTAMPIDVKDCAFDGTAISVSSYGANAGNASYDYNAHTGASNPFTIGGANNVPSVTFAWITGPLGHFYVATNSVLRNEGSRNADVAGLYHFTMSTNLVSNLQIKETNSVVDIGYHYVALDSNSLAIDTDSDGTPDYREDSNGDGGVDSGETDWEDPYDLGLKVIITQPKRNANIP